jgi:hypothetical protein
MNLSSLSEKSLARASNSVINMKLENYWCDDMMQLDKDLQHSDTCNIMAKQVFEYMSDYYIERPVPLQTRIDERFKQTNEHVHDVAP